MCRRPAAGLRLYHLGASALSPDFQLLDRCRAEGVRGAEQNILPLRSEHLSEFADGGGLAGAVHAYDQDDLRRAINFLHRA